MSLFCVSNTPVHRRVFGEILVSPGPETVIDGEADFASATNASRRRILIGRDDEFDVLSAMLDSMFSGKGHTAVIAGEPGIGKTFLVSYAQQEAERRGARVISTTCSNVAGMPPLWLWRQIVSQLTNPEAIIKLLDELIPEVMGGESSSQSDYRRFELFSNILSALHAAADGEPLLLCIDDMQWADTASQGLFTFIASQIGQHPLLLSACLRTSGTDLGPDSRAMLSELNRLESAVRIEPRLLNTGETRELIESTVGHTVTPGVASQIANQSRGVPLFVKELSKSIEARGQSIEDSMPDTVAELFGARLDDLSSDAQRVVAAAAVLGNSFGADEILTLLQSSDIADASKPSFELVLSGIDEASTAGAVHSSNVAAGAFEFTHPLYLEVARERVPAGSRASMHATAGRRIEESYGNDAALHASELAWHFKHAAPVLGTDQMIFYSLIAGQSALRSFAWPEALEHFENVRSAVEPDLSRVELAHAWLGIARSRFTYESTWGSSLGPADIEAGLTTAIDIFIDHGETDLVLEAASQGIFGEPGWSPSPALAERAIEFIEDDSTISSRLLTRLADTLWTDENRSHESEPMFERALELARDHDDFAAQIQNYRIHTQFLVDGRQYERALANCTAALNLQHHSPNSSNIPQLHMLAAAAQGSLGDTAGALETLEMGLASMTALGMESSRYHYAVAAIEFKRANFEEMIRHALELDRLKPTETSPLYFVLKEAHTGDVQSALQQLRQLIDSTPVSPLHLPTLLVYASVAVSLGREIKDEEAMIEGRTLAQSLRNRFELDLGALTVLDQIELHLVIGLNQTDQAPDHYDQLLPFARTYDLPFSGELVDLQLAQLSLIVGEHARAFEHFESSLAVSKNGGLVLSECETIRYYAEALLEHGSRVERATAIELLKSGIALAEQHSLRFLGEKMSGILAATTQGKVSHPAGLTAREVDVARLLVAGKSNPQIGEELFISLNTVLRHVSNIFGKLGVSSRTEAAIKAVELGVAEKP
jgi:DNA-binding CsgD family transcriptional regulator